MVALLAAGEMTMVMVRVRNTSRIAMEMSKPKMTTLMLLRRQRTKIAAKLL